MAEENKPVNVSIIIPDAIKGGHYANIFNVTTTAAREVIVDFVFVHPRDKDNSGNLSGTVVSRIIMPVQLAVALKLALESQLGKNKKE